MWSKSGACCRISFDTQNGGTLVNNFGAVGLDAGNWTLVDGSLNTTSNFSLTSSQTLVQNGGSINVGGDLGVSGGSSYTLNNGTATFGDDVNFSGGSITIAGGTFSGDVFNAATGGSFTMSGGTLNVNTFGTALSFFDGGQVFNLNGGTITATGDFGLYGDTTDNQVTFGGSTTGSLTAASLVGGAGQYTIDWLAGSQMSMTITGSTTWAETEYNANRLLFGGQDATALGLTWAQATSGGTQIWDFTGNTLSLVPEPSTWALISVGLTTMVLFRRRRNV